MACSFCFWGISGVIQAILAILSAKPQFEPSLKGKPLGC